MPGDLLLFHPPSYLYFRSEKRNYGPISDVIPSTPVFDMYPIGFFTLTTYLSKLGFRVTIKNIAARLIMSPRYDYRKMIRGSHEKVVAIDLHWMVHSHGAIELARIVKSIDPSKIIVLGGISSTIFYREIMEKYPWIDAIILGDTVEPAMALLLQRILDGNGKLEGIPNLVYRENGKIRSNGLKFVPPSLDPYAVDYNIVVREMVRSGDPLSFIPYATFARDPIGAVLSLKGCTYNCVTCGGSRFTYNRFLGRSFIGRKKPETIVFEIRSIIESFKMPVFVVGDLQLYGHLYIERLSGMLREEKLDVPLIFEFFVPPPANVIKTLARASPRVFFQISPESHDENVRKAFGRPYNNSALERFIHSSLQSDIERLDLYFMIGLPGQNFWNAVSLYRYADKLFREYGSERLDIFVAPLAPFVDPGSPAYANPSRYGYVLHAHSLSEHMELLRRGRDWRDMLNYETLWLTRDELAQATYETAKRLLGIKLKHGIIGEKEYRRIVESMSVAYEGKGDRLLEKDTLSIRELYPHASFFMGFKKRSLLPIAMLSILFNYLRFD